LIIVQNAQKHLVQGGWLLIEHGWQQAPQVKALMAAAGFQKIQSKLDLAGIERCSGGQK
jgi:release factor glutamine methyltransferase